MRVNWKFIGEQEGAGVCTGYVPVAATSNSGVTIATGADLGQQSSGSGGAGSVHGAAGQARALLRI